MICKKEYSYEEKIQVENEGDYAKEVGCRVLFVNYRLAPKHQQQSWHWKKESAL